MDESRTPSPSVPPAAILIGGSAGALEVVSTVLGAMPTAYQHPIVVLLHVGRNTRSALAPALGANCRLPVREALGGEPLAPGTVYVAPPDYHLLVDPGPVLALSVDEPVSFSIPSIDVLFESAADVLGSQCAAVLLSGANADGARGLRAVAEAGGQAIVQAPGEAAWSTMPAAALAACPEARTWSTERIIQWLQELASPP